MKQFSLAVTLLGALILGACSTSNQVVGGGIFHKRKYTGGVYVDRSEKKKEAKEKEVEDVNYDILSVSEEKQEKYVSSQIIRPESKSIEETKLTANVKKEAAEVKEIAKKSNVEAITEVEEVEFDIYKSAAQKIKKYSASQEIRQSNKVNEIEAFYADDQTMASSDENSIPASVSAKKEDEAVVINNTKKKKNVKMSSKSLLGGDTILYVILAILLPPLAVGLYEGITTRFWISLLLTILFWLPGVIYAILVVTGTI